MIEPFIPGNRRGVKPKNNRRILSGIMHVLKTGCRLVDCPPEYGPHTTTARARRGKGGREKRRASWRREGGPGEVDSTPAGGLTPPPRHHRRPVGQPNPRRTPACQKGGPRRKSKRGRNKKLTAKKQR